MKHNEHQVTHLPLWKIWVFSCLTIFLIFCFIEISLKLVGIKPLTDTNDPYVGFVPSIPLFVEKEQADGTTRLETAKNKRRFFNQQSFPSKKADHTFRIFCMGGSTTYGRPYNDKTSFCGWLREYLIASDPDKNWEVINAGGISYASYRVVSLMQELINYEPDLFIVYSGHNEFLERRTYARIIDQPPFIRSLDTTLNNSRLYTVMKSIKQKIVSSKNTKKKLREEKNNSLDEEVNTLLDNSIGLSAYTRDDPLKQQIMQHYKFNLQKMIGIAKHANSQILFVTPASNLRSSSPFKSEFKTSISKEQKANFIELLERGKRLLQQKKLKESIKVLQQAAQIDDRYAETCYVLGHALFEDGQMNASLQSFERARNEDICPLRILSPMLNILRQVAVENNIDLVDFEDLINRRSLDQYNHKIPGQEFFLDHVHPDIETNRTLALALLDQLSEMEIVHFKPDWSNDDIAWIKQQVESQIDIKPQALALRNLAKVLSWAGKTDEAARLAQQSLLMSEDDAENFFILGTQAINEKRWQDAEQFYRRAIDIDPGYVKAQNNLALVLVQSDQIDEAIEHYNQAIKLDPEYVNAHFNLANAYHRLNKKESAIQHYREALRLMPDDVDASFNLASLFAKDGRLEEAVELYSSASTHAPDDPDVHFNLARTLMRLHRYDQAHKELTKVLELAPEDAQAHYNLGLVLEHHDQFNKAVVHYKKALKYKPDWDEPKERLVLLRKH